MSSPRLISTSGVWIVTLTVLFAFVPIFTSGVSQIQYFGRKVLVEGDTLDIQCVATIFEPIQWLKDGKTLVNGSNDYLWHNRNDNNVIKSSLTVSHVDIHHSGSYQCTPVHHESLHVYVVSANLITAEYDFDDKKIITPHKTLELKCSIAKAGYTFVWKKGSEEIKDGVESKKESDESYVSKLTISKPTDENAGTYECIAKLNSSDPDNPSAVINVISLPTASMENDVIVVEGEKLTLDCHPTGVPAPNISWLLENITLNSSTDRIKLLHNKNNVSNAILQIADVKLSDRGDYKCVLSNIASIHEGKDIEESSKVRVKDKLAALWPFLGICAEVFVLCAIIFIYEKKRNKAELDESDTDNSPEQKNTPDHGKDSVRQRK